MRGASVGLPAPVKQTEKTQTPLRDGATGCPPARRQECANSGHSPDARRAGNIDPLPPYKIGLLNGREALESRPSPAREMGLAARREGDECNPPWLKTLNRRPRSPSPIQEQGIPACRNRSRQGKAQALAHRRAAFRIHREPLASGMKPRGLPGRLAPSWRPLVCKVP